MSEPVENAPPVAPSRNVVDAPAILPRRAPVGVVMLSGLASAVLLVAIVLGNVALARVSVRMDLTEERLYTLSAATRGILEKLPEQAEIKVFWSDEIPTQFRPTRDYAQGLLEEYAVASHGRVNVEWVDMSGPGGPEEARKKSIEEFRFQAKEKANKLSASSGYMGIYIQYEDKHESLSPIDEFKERLEYEVTSRLWKMSRPTTPVIGLVREMPPFSPFMPQQPHGERFQRFGEELEKAFGTSARTYLTLDDPIASDVSVLIVAAPKEMSEKKAFHLEQFLLRGGKVVLLLDAVNLESLVGTGQPIRSGLEDWLKEQGVDVPSGALADYAKDSTAFYAAPNRQTGFYDVAPYPYWLRLHAKDIDQKNPGTADMDEIVLYWPSQVDVDAKKQAEAGRTATVLATTSEGGYLRSDLMGLASLSSPDVVSPEGKTLGKHPVMVMLEGAFTSHWKGKPSPDEPPPKPEDAKSAADPKKPDGATPAGGAMDGEAPAMSDAPPPAMGETPPAPPPGMPDEPPGMATEPPAPPPAPPGMQDGEKPPEPPGMGEAPPMDGGAKGPDGPGGEKPAGEPKKDDKPARLDEGKGVLVVLGDAGLISDESLRFARFNGAAGYPFVLNFTDWLTGSEDLLSLRSRGTKPRQIDEVSDDTISGIRLGNTLVAPLLILMAGLVVYFVRRHGR